MHLRPADAAPEDVDELTEVAHAAKRHWGYPEEWIALWSDELTVRRRYLVQHRVRVVRDAGILGWCATSRDEKGIGWLDACWVRPASAGRGIGRLLVEDAVRIAGNLGASALQVIADPNAVGFYEKLGFIRIGEEPSTPEGRRLPVLARPLGSTRAGQRDTLR